MVVNDPTPAYNILMTDVSSLVGLMVLDTACQRTCCGTQWLSQQVQLLSHHRLSVKHVGICEAFQFGRGQPLYAKDRVYMPVTLGGKLFLIGSSVVETSIPLLASSSFMELLDTVVDLGKQQVLFRALGVCVPILKINGHLAVSISDFFEHVHEDSVWHELSKPFFWKQPHPEIVIPRELLDLKPQQEQDQPSGVFAVSDASSASSTMAAALEASAPDAPQLGDHDHSHDVPHGEVGHGTAKLAQSSRDRGPSSRTRDVGPGHESATVPPIGMHSSRLEEVRQSHWQLRSMHSVPHSSTVGSPRTSMGGNWSRAIGKLFFAAALTFKYFAGFAEIPENNHFQGQSQESGLSIFSESFERSFCSTSSTACAPGLESGHRGQSSSDPSRADAEVDADGGRGWQPSDGLAGNGKSARSIRVGRGRRLMSDGHKKYLIGKLRKARHALKVEADTYEVLANNHRKFRNKVDILETFAGNANISKKASNFGLKAAMPLDYNTGVDLSTVQGQNQCSRLRRSLRPLVLVQGIHCTPWLIMQENMNYQDRMDELESIRDQERPTLDQAMKWCCEQHDDGNYYLIENPQSSRLWTQQCVENMIAYTGGQAVTCHAGAYGGTNSKGQLIKKTYQFVSNNSLLLEFLCKKLDPLQLQQCVPLEGKEVTLSQHYPEGLVHAILKGIKKVARLKDPARFQVNKVYATFSQPLGGQQEWRHVLSLASDYMSKVSSKDLILHETDPLYVQIQDLLPWQLTRIQISSKPIVNRQPTLIPYTHRGSALKYVDKLEVDVTVEDLSEIHLPRSRFKSPVELGIFWYGYPNEIDEQLGIPAAEAMIRDQLPVDDAGTLLPTTSTPTTTNEIFHDEIAFPNVSGIDRSIKVSVSRMHKNLGHLPPAEMLKLLAMNGITSDQVIKCIKAMQCAACLRSRGPLRPNPASPPQYVGQFADNLQADIFYLRDLTSKNHPILGVICEATHLHCAARLTTRNPVEVFEAFRSIWLHNFGYPLRLSVDDDGAFKAEFDDRVSEGGTFLRVVPGEAHHQIGVIERHNGTLRMLLERIVDSMPCMQGSDIDLALVSALQAKNSATWSSGRPPYIAAFGKIPRFGVDLLSDPRALVSGSNRSEAQQQSALMRCEALKALAEASASSTLRRALLRKSAQQLQLEPQPGSLLAYWRWTTRSHRKRGGYRIARYLGRDPDGSLWLQSGNNTVRVAENQVRDVFGYEDYIPDRQDLEALKNAEDNIRSDLWTDDSLPAEVPPPQLGTHQPEPDDFEYPELNLPSATATTDVPSTTTQPTQQKQAPPTTKPTIHLHQNIQQTQNIFSPVPPGVPVPHTPSRRQRSRTPVATRHKTQDRHAILPDPQPASSSRELPDTLQQTQQHSTQRQPLDTSQPQTLPQSTLQQPIPLVDLTDDVDDPGDMVPFYTTSTFGTTTTITT